MKLGTRTIWGALLAAGLAHEVYTVANKRRGDTLSELVWAATDSTPLVPLAIGVVVGHWFWPRRTGDAR
jgi:hypothetical protein